MKITTIARGAAGAMFLLSTGFALAAEWDWAPEREHGFYERFSTERHVEPRAGFDVRVGGVVPEGVDVYDAPADYEYAPARQYRYVTHEKKVYVVEPKTRRVVHIIER